MQYTRTIAKASVATAALAAVGVSGLAMAPAASAAPVLYAKNTSASTPKISLIADKTVKAGTKVKITGGAVSVPRGVKVVSKKIHVKRVGSTYKNAWKGWGVAYRSSHYVGAGRWTVRTEVRYTTASQPKKIKKVFLTSGFVVKSKAAAKPAYKVSSTRAAMWNRVAKCESGGNWKINTGNGYYGGLQFKLSTWRGYGGQGMPQHNSKAEQIRIAEKVLKGQGAGAWGGCGRKAGLHR